MTSRRPEPFDAAKRAALLAMIAEGASLRQACVLAGVDRKTVARWRKGAAPAHRAFATSLEKAIAEGTHEAYKRLDKHSKAADGSNGAVRATLALLAARDPRFGDIDLRREKLRAEADAARSRLEQDRERHAVELRQATARAVIAERAAVQAEGGGRSLIIGVRDVLLDESVSEDARRELAAWVERTGAVRLDSWDLGSQDPDALESKR